MEKRNDDVLMELRKMNRLLTFIALEAKPQKEKITFLDQLGLSYAEIGEVLEMKPDAVRMAIQRAQKGK